MNLLDRQPMPSGGGEPVWPRLATRLEVLKASDKAYALIWARHEQGMVTYGQDLMTHDGRDAWSDLIQELADAVFYAQRVTMEGGYDMVPRLIETLDMALVMEERR
jgi:hypothetical protein